MSLDSKLANVSTTIFSVMSALAAEHGAINLSQGFPDFEPDEKLVARVSHHLKSAKNQYAPMPGVTKLREAISEKIYLTQKLNVNPESDITITCGATEALFNVIQAVVRPSDEVIVFDPCYDSYEPAVTLAGGITTHLPLMPPDFSIDWQTLEDSLNKKTRLVIINSPHNPSGSVLVEKDLQKLAEMIRPYSCYVLSDEVYEHIVFDGQAHAGILNNKELREKAFAVFSFGKTYHATGWKIGYCIAATHLTREFRKVHQYNTFSTITPIQWALADFIEQHPESYLGLSGFYQRKRDLFTTLLESSRFGVKPSRGTYFQLADYSDISDLSDLEFANQLTSQYGVAVIPLSPFYQLAPEDRLIRFCFAKRDNTLKQAAEILCRI